MPGCLGLEAKLVDGEVKEEQSVRSHRSLVVMERGKCYRDPVQTGCLG